MTFSRTRSLRAPVRLLAPLVALAALVAVPKRADACSAPLPGLTQTTPADGETYPANAALRFDGDSISLDGVSVDIDGVPATLVKGESPGLSVLLAMIDPEPAPGQTVTITGDFCEGCEPVKYSFTAGEPDLDTPVVSELFFTAFDHGPFKTSGGDCMSDSDLSIYVHADVAPQVPGQAPVRYHIVFDPDDGKPEAPGFESAGILQPGETLDHAISMTLAQLGDVAASDLCVKVTIDDLAGNGGELGQFVEICKPCFLRTSEDAESSETPQEPAWSDADAVPGSACAGPPVDTEGSESGDESSSGSTGDTSDSSGEPTTAEPPPTGTGEGTAGEGTAGEGTAGEGTGGDTSEQDDDDKGCGCRSRDNSGGALALLVGLFGLIARRRR